MTWDKEEAEKLRKKGLTQEQIGFVLGRIADHRQQADREGWKRGKGFDAVDRAHKSFSQRTEE